MPPLHFLVFVATTFAVFLGVLLYVLRARDKKVPISRLLGVAFLVVVVGMCFAKIGANSGLPWSIYYGVPALLTLVVPPAAFRMKRGELIPYLVLAFVLSPVIHVIFSFFVGWHEYLPFWHVPSFSELSLTHH